MDGQDRYRRHPNDLFSDTSNQSTRNAVSPVGAEHDEVRANLVGNVADLTPGRPLTKEPGDFGDPRPKLTNDCVDACSGALLERDRDVLERNERRTGVSVDGRRVNVEDRQLCAESRCQGHRALEGCVARRTEVGRNQNSLEGRHPHPKSIPCAVMPTRPHSQRWLFGSGANSRCRPSTRAHGEDYSY